ncbi:PREDICTED: protein FRIGIDA-ESSENTIAL 1 isoform X2 [Lupinus angustifolius]|uniref:protein FRIGIDA-ESSENTIAL 1 isoform X2 n=1 Tax=Lupinus angustifolius TaxID=3871 RepID=UPI00092FD713|nr:PREDICTED: protein FRIGIDA-ESSENTIAL 1 isoform X2 [Lupinus angustifolius]
MHLFVFPMLMAISEGFLCWLWREIDSCLHMESPGQDGNLKPVSSMAENNEVMPSSSMHLSEKNEAILEASVPSCETLTLNKEEFHSKHEISSNPKSRENATIVEGGNSQGLNVDTENAGSLPQSKTFVSCNELSCNNEAELCGVEDMDARATKSSNNTGKDVAIGLPERDDFVKDAVGGQKSKNEVMLSEMETSDSVKEKTPRRTRSGSPNAEMKDGNKRLRHVCDFFAKGWCIRGSSCRFLHIKDPVNNTDQETDGDSITANQTRELELKEGVRGNVERSRTNEQEASPTWHPSQEKQKFPLRDNLLQESRFAFNASSNYFNTNHSSYSTRSEGMATAQNQHMYNGYTSAILSHSPNSSLAAQFPATSMSLSHRSGISLPFSSSYSDRDYHAPRSTFSVSGQEDLPLGSSSSRGPPHSSGYKSKVDSYDWEPSVPFQPSFFITSMSGSSPGDLYDPLRDSIEIPNIGDGSLKASLLIHRPSVEAPPQVQTYGDSAVVGKHKSDVNDAKSSVSSHIRINENELSKRSVPHEKDCLVTEAEITSGTDENYQNSKIGMEQYTIDVEDFTTMEKERTGRDTRHHGEGSGHKKRRVDRDKKISEMDVDSVLDGSLQKESKALKNFHAVLVDHVKDLLKPYWHEGHLSKDAHIVIVKKSVDKVISTLEPHQIPTTIDTAKHYVSSCRMKIAKLVDGYVNKYSKS